VHKSFSFFFNCELYYYYYYYVTGIIILFFDERLELLFFVQGQEKERAWMWNLRVVHGIGFSHARKKR
jgi:hypothetical protein